ncbi:MAG TPA: OpcA/G6PD domain-containing protein [Polyangiaceae bacterium]|nr:OpcA/G6PD domain-containing protein [Polyangiaceae bacterium]
MSSELAESRPISDKLNEIEAALAGLWQSDVKEQASAHAHTQNLLALCDATAGHDFTELVDDISSQLAARTFMLRIDPRADPTTLRGDVSAVCRKLPGESEPVVCAERLELVLGSLTAQRLRSILDTLLDARLSTVLFVGPGAPAAVVGAIATSGTGVVLDSALYGVARSAEICARSSARFHDLAFIRVRRWRELVARFFDDPRLLPALRTVRALEIGYVPGSQCRWASAEAELLVAWLATRLGWRTEMGELWDASGVRVEVSFLPRESAQVSAGFLQSFALRAELSRGSVLAKIAREGDGEHLVWSLTADGLPDACQKFLVPHRTAADVATRAVSDVGFDPLAREALGFARAWARTS